VVVVNKLSTGWSCCCVFCTQLVHHQDDVGEVARVGEDEDVWQAKLANSTCLTRQTYA
jgi:uncharacterized protein YfcZ (UPF0381/DUF406 family)